MPPRSCSASTREDDIRVSRVRGRRLIIELARNAARHRDERYFRVLKLRGSAYREGQHAFRITSDGIELYPRLVRPRIPEGYEPLNERMSTGVAGLDAMLWAAACGAGRRRCSPGPTGAGKTTMALQFALEGAQHGEPGAVHELPGESGAAHAAPSRRWAWTRRPRRRRTRARVCVAGGAADRQHHRGHLRRISEGEVQRLVIDAVGDLASAASDPQRLHDYLYSLVQHFAVNGVTTLLTHGDR